MGLGLGAQGLGTRLPKQWLSTLACFPTAILQAPPHEGGRFFFFCLSLVAGMYCYQNVHLFKLTCSKAFSSFWQVRKSQ